MQTEFRAVNGIELHDAGLCIHAKGNAAYYVADWGWSAFGALGGTHRAYHLSGQTYRRLMNQLGFIPDADLAQEGIYLEAATGSEEQGDDDQVIHELSARIEGEKILSIRVRFDWHDDKDETRDYAEVTYCGAFTVWWK